MSKEKREEILKYIKELDEEYTALEEQYPDMIAPALGVKTQEELDYVNTHEYTI